METLQAFGPYEEAVLSQAAEVAEESVSDFFRITESFWSENPYELRTVKELQPGEISQCCLAQVLKMRSPPGRRQAPGQGFFPHLFAGPQPLGPGPAGKTL